MRLNVSIRKTRHRCRDENFMQPRQSCFELAPIRLVVRSDFPSAFG